MISRDALWLTCRKCLHTWAAITTPITFRGAMRFLRNVTCPKCHADGDHLFGARDHEIEIAEERQAAQRMHAT